KEDMFDFWIGKGDANEAVSLYEALMARKTGMVTYAQGYRPDDKLDQKLIDEAVKNANAADVVVVNIGISGKLAGEDRAIAMPEVPAAQIRLLEALKKTGKPVVALVNAGRPLVLTPIKDLVSSIV
ncbi:MAG TPA: beta-glucosidase, partial [Chitinophagaceae bacterium]|nr:beta-glucosidase [Chitinophagaceae bacterium]